MRIDEIDLIRGVGILAVVMVHVVSHGIFYSYGNATANVILDALSRFCVPFFVFVSGAVFSYNYHDKKKYYGNFLFKRLRYIAIPYLLWSILGFVRYKIYAPQKIIIGLLTGNAMIHLYFIVLIFQFYIMSPILIHLCKINWKKTIVPSFLVNIMVLSVYSYLPIFANMNVNLGEYLQPFINPLFWFAYFVAGITVGINMDGFRELVARLRLTTLFTAWFFIMVISICEEYFIYVNKGFIQHFFRPSNMLYSFVSIIFLWKLHGRINSCMKQVFSILGRYSFGIYLSHIPILFVIHKITKPYWGNPLELLFSFFVCTGISFTFTFLISRTKAGVLIVGKA